MAPVPYSDDEDNSEEEEDEEEEEEEAPTKKRSKKAWKVSHDGNKLVLIRRFEWLIVY